MNLLEGKSLRFVIAGFCLMLVAVCSGCTVGLKFGGDGDIVQTINLSPNAQFLSSRGTQNSGEKAEVWSEPVGDAAVDFDVGTEAAIPVIP